jgi:predicted HicB family RNase H-like nuclease
MPRIRKGRRVEQHQDRVNVNLRFDEELHKQLVAEAKRRVRSLNGEVIYRLRQSLADDGAEEATA